MLLPLYARHKARHRQERNTESNAGKRQKATAASVRKAQDDTTHNNRKEKPNCNERAIGGEEEGKR